MDTKTAHIGAGWKVVDSEGSTIGEVTEAREDHLVVSAGTLIKHDLYVPIDHIKTTHDEEVTVDIRAGEVDAEGWRYPPNASYVHQDPAYPEVPETTTIQTAGYSAGRLSAPEPQGAVLNDGQIDPAEVPNADVVPDEEEDRVVENEDRLR